MGAGGDALAGKDCLWVTTTGATDDAYSPQGKHGHRFEAFVAGGRADRALLRDELARAARSFTART